MTFTDALIASGYRFDDGENYDDAWVKIDSEGFMHFYFEGEDEGEWNYVKMTEDYDVVTEVTFNPETDSIV